MGRTSVSDPKSAPDAPAATAAELAGSILQL